MDFFIKRIEKLSHENFFENDAKTVAKNLLLCYPSIAVSIERLCHYSLAVRTLASHAENWGSIPHSGTKKCSTSVDVEHFFVPLLG